MNLVWFLKTQQIIRLTSWEFCRYCVDRSVQNSSAKCPVSGRRCSSVTHVCRNSSRRKMRRRCSRWVTLTFTSSRTSSPATRLTLWACSSLTSLSLCSAPCGLRVVRIDPLCFLAGCHKRQIIQVLSVMCLCMFFIALLFIRAPFYVLLVFVGMCSAFWLFWLCCQYLSSDWLERLHWGSLTVVIISIKPRLKWVYDFIGLLYSLIV